MFCNFTANLNNLLHLGDARLWWFWWSGSRCCRWTPLSGSGSCEIQDALLSLLTSWPSASRQRRNTPTVPPRSWRQDRETPARSAGRRARYISRSELTAVLQGSGSRFLRSGPARGCRGRCRWWRPAAPAVWPAPPCSFRPFRWGVWWYRSSAAAESRRFMSFNKHTFDCRTFPNTYLFSTGQKRRCLLIWSPCVTNIYRNSCSQIILFLCNYEKNERLRATRFPSGISSGFLEKWFWIYGVTRVVEHFFQ